MPKIIKAELTSKPLNNILVGSLESKKLFNESKILLAIIVMFELLRYNIKYLFLPIEIVAVMVCFLSSQLTYKNSTLYYKAVKVTINVSDFAEVISNMVVYHHNFSNLAIGIKTFSDIVVCHHDFSGLVYTNSGTLYPLGTCHCYIMFYVLDTVFLLHPICKPIALPKSQIAANKAYSLTFYQF